MFTGIVETIGSVRRTDPDRIWVTPEDSFSKVRLGESISVDGVCLTVDQVRGRALAFRLLPETARVSTLGRLVSGSRVNLERALRAGDRLGGHLLLGHVDGQGEILRSTAKTPSMTLEIRAAGTLVSLLVPKGPIAVDGVSLTLDPQLERDRFRVHLVSHTLKRTLLGRKKPGQRVNLELDPILKYLKGML
ncbi:MAG: riboflavin synthase [Candidatus Omnitrophica bacterium]|nr:riboflavin synthase [Candidatus Omnitrophota bacterium]